MDFVEEVMKKSAPDVLLGFSQGSNLCHPLAARCALGRSGPIACVVHFCTTKPGWVAQNPELFEYQIPVPALLIEGKVDEVAQGAADTALTYADPVVLKHSDGHRPFPRDVAEARELAKKIRDFVLLHCRGLAFHLVGVAFTIWKDDHVCGNASGDLPSIPWLPGMPVDFDLSMKDGKPSAVAVRHVLNFHSASDMGFAGGSTARSAGKAAIAMKADTGHTLVGCLGSLVTGHHGMGGADLIALHLAQDLSQGFVGREQGGVKGAKAAMVAGLQNTQQRFMQYAQRLSANSAKIWLTAETHALMALVFGFEGPEAKPCLLLGDVGSEGRALVLHRDGSISQRIGYQGRREEGKAQDALKAFKHGLKGPSISFPPIPGAQMLKEKKGFGAHVKAAVTAQLEVCTLDWTDATLIMASKSFWECLDETQVAGLVTLSSPCSLAESLFEAACARRRGRTMEDLAVVVLRFPWVFVKASPTPQEAKGRKTPKTKKRKVEEVDDIFAPAPAQAEVEQEVDSEESSLEEEEDLPEPRMMAQPKGGLQGATSHDENLADMAPKRGKGETKTAKAEKEKALLNALEGYSLEAESQTPKSQKPEAEKEAKAKSKAKAKAKGKSQNEAKSRAKTSEKPKDSVELAPAKPAKSEEEPPSGKKVLSSSELRDQFHSALLKLDDLACVKRQRVMPAEL
eukprot:symbB.v1.2.030205.t1/scaffold3377.1/size107121/5